MKRSTGESLGRITVSLGVAELRPDETATSLLDRGDACMYRAKNTGRNRTVTDLDEPGDARLPTAA
jgi:diguanylate cyclase